MNVKESLNITESCDYIISITRSEPNENVAIQPVHISRKSKKMEVKEQNQKVMDPNPKEKAEFLGKEKKI